MRDLVGVLRQRLVVIFARGLGIEREVEMVVPAEVEARPRERVVTELAPPDGPWKLR